MARRTDGFTTTVARTLAHAEWVTGGAFMRAGHRPDEPFARVRICYRLGTDPPACGLDDRALRWAKLRTP